MIKLFKITIFISTDLAVARGGWELQLANNCIFVCTSWTLIYQKNQSKFELTKINHTTWFSYTVSDAFILEDNILSKLLCSTFELNVDFEG